MRRFALTDHNVPRGAILPTLIAGPEARSLARTPGLLETDRLVGRSPERHES